MTNEASSLTVDSFHGFKYKKRFSFVRKNERDETTTATTGDGDKEQNDNEDEKLSESELSPSKKPYQLKGTAKLKSRDSSSEEDEKPVKKVAGKKKKRKNSSSEEDAQVEQIEKELAKLYKLHPNVSKARVKSVFFEQDFNIKKSIDVLVNEEVNKSVESDTIEEWSDGDEKISASNKAKKQAKVASSKKNKNRISDESSEETILSSSSSNSIASGSLDAAQSKKRKMENKIEDTKQPTKKMRRVVIESDESDNNNDDDDESTRTSTRSTSTTASTSQRKKKVLDSSTSETEKKKKSSKSKKKEKKSKKSKKKKPIEDDEDGASAGSADEYHSEGDSENSDAEEQLSDDQKSAILKLFNNSSLEDIQSMMNISTKRLETLLSLRPFQDFDDLKKRLSQRSLLPYIESAKDIIHARGMVNDLLEKCKRISERMEKQVSSLIDQSSDNTESGSSNKSTKLEIKTQPKLLNKELQLKPYQLIGLNWLCLMHKENINGILADEMGLGKTCQTISFLTHLLESQPRLTHLIIVPPSTLDNWVRELSTWSPHFYFTVYQGSLEERRELRYNVLNNKFEKHLNCILTTYGLISSTHEDKAFFKKLQLEYCVFDEAHMLKNMNSQRYQSLIQIKSRRKLLLTGTPLQNNIVELMSLLYFVMPDIFHLKTQYLNKIFASKPANVDKDTFYAEKISQAKGIMKPFILRRLKTEVLKQLPKKTIEVMHCDMSQRQSKEYGVLVEYYKQRKDQLLKEAEAAVVASTTEITKSAASTSKYDDVLEIIEQNVAVQREAAKKQAQKKKNVKETSDSSSNIIMELRKAANHPLLRRTYYTDEKLKQMAKIIMKESSPDTVFDYVVEDLSVMNDFQIHKLCPLYKGLKGHELNQSLILDSGKFTVLNSILEEKKKSGDRVLIFSQFVIMLDIVEEFLKIKSYKYLRLDGQTAVNDRQDLIDSYNENSDIFVFMLSTKAGGMGINLTAANVCIMHDIDFNPFNDKQAEDRCHRVGQTKQVQVYKLLSKNTIDETMMKIQEKKLELGADISGENDTHSKSDMVSMLKEALNF